MAENKDFTERIDTDKESIFLQRLREKINLEVVGQDRAIRHILRSVAAYYSGLKDPRRPIGGFIFAGPTGVGKTWLAKVFARHFLKGSDRYRDYLTRIDCSTLSQEHEVARLIGSPPGYVAYGEPSMLSQTNIDSYHFDVTVGDDDDQFAESLRRFEAENAGRNNRARDEESFALEFEYRAHKPYCSIIVFDEIEKAHPHIWNVLLQIMEEGELQLGKSGKKTIFSNSIIILTTNIGQRNIQEMLKGGIGFKVPQQDIQDKSLDQKIYETVKNNVEKKFPPELFKRLDLVVFRPLRKEDFANILDLFLSEEQEKLDELVKKISQPQIEIEYTLKAKMFLLDKGVDIHYGARALRSIIEKYVRAPISNGLSSREIQFGDKILVDAEDDKLAFFRQPRPEVQPVIEPQGPVAPVIEIKEEKPEEKKLIPERFNN